GIAVPPTEPAVDTPPGTELPGPPNAWPPGPLEGRTKPNSSRCDVSCPPPPTQTCGLVSRETSPMMGPPVPGGPSWKEPNLCTFSSSFDADGRAPPARRTEILAVREGTGPCAKDQSIKATLGQRKPVMASRPRTPPWRTEVVFNLARTMPPNGANGDDRAA